MCWSRQASLLLIVGASENPRLRRSASATSCTPGVTRGTGRREAWGGGGERDGEGGRGKEKGEGGRKGEGKEEREEVEGRRENGKGGRGERARGLY